MEGTGTRSSRGGEDGNRRPFYIFHFWGSPPVTTHPRSRNDRHTSQHTATGQGPVYLTPQQGWPRMHFHYLGLRIGMFFPRGDGLVVYRSGCTLHATLGKGGGECPKHAIAPSTHGVGQQVTFWELRCAVYEPDHPTMKTASSVVSRG